ncbi:3-hydroxyacyl-CoA dehydrogenase family protein [Chloroflexota bacterium]
MKPEDIKCIGVIGGGIMGSGIAQTAIVAGYKVVLRDLADEILEKAKSSMVDGRFGLKGGVERGKITQEQMNQALANLTLTTKVEDLKDCDFVIEAIGVPKGQKKDLTGMGGGAGLEDKDLKKRVFAELDKIVKKSAILASNTSYCTISDLAEAVGRKNLFLGMHFFSPANIMKLVELIYTPDTSEEVMQVMEAVCKRLNKISIRVKDVPGDTGFVANRIFQAVRKEARKIVEEGVTSPDDVDIAVRAGFNWPAGPFELSKGARGGW